MTTDLQKLVTRVPDKFIGDNGRGMDAMDHTVITQLLLYYLGPFSFEVTEVIYDSSKKAAHDRVVTGVIGKLTVEIDGKTVTVTEPGGVENANNIDGGGERAKHAASDSLKRCAMRLGLGLHLWAQDMYFLDRKLNPEGAGTDG